MRTPKIVLLCLSVPCLAAVFSRGTQALSESLERLLSAPVPHRKLHKRLPQPDTRTTDQQLERAITSYKAQAYYYTHVQHKTQEASQCLLAAQRLQTQRMLLAAPGG